jgi:PAS domain S-box-containing protein
MVKKEIREKRLRLITQGRLNSARGEILKNWFTRMNSERAAPFGTQSRVASMNALPKFLDHLGAMLKRTNSESNDFDYKLLVSDYGIQRAQINDYTLKQVSSEFTVLQEIVFNVLKEKGESLTVEECKTIDFCFQTAVTEAGSAFVETMKSARDFSETQLNLLVKEAKEYAIFMIGPTGIILTWNEGAERMKQFTSKDAIGRNYEIFYREEDKKEGRPLRNIKLSLQDGRHEEQWWRRKKDGTLFWADAVITPVYSPAGPLIGFSKIVRDLSLKKHTEDQLRAAKESAEAASGLKSVFVANMSHEIRTPLGAILGFSEFLKDPNCPAENRLLAADVIDRNGKVLLRLIDDILDISKIEAGKLEIELSEVSPRDLASEVIALFVERAQDKGLFLKLGNADGVVKAIQTDPVRLRQILSNIVGNAVKFTERGEITVNIHDISLGQGGRGIEFIVTDSGIGLTSEERKTLFMPFSQADNTTTRKMGGSGLGLALSRRLAENLGGNICILDDQDARGSSFRITIADMDFTYLNAHSDVAVAPAVEDPTQVVHSLNTADTKVLVVDDSLDNQMLIELYLDQWGFKHDVANNGAEAVKMALQDDYDLILMDIQMPILDGNQAMRQLRQAGYSRPIVAVTAHAMIEEKEKAFDSGCDDYLIKPIDGDRLYRVLKKYSFQGSASLTHSS